MENQTPRTHPTFWRSPAGVATAVVGGVAAVAGVIALFEKKAAAAPVVPATPVIPPGTPPVTTATGAVTGLTPGAYYLFQVNATSNPGMGPSTGTPGVLQTAGFASVESQPDPTTADNWVTTAQWASTATSFTPTAGWSINGSMGAPLLSTPPAPTPYVGDNGSGGAEPLLTNGNWYSFVIRTSFYSTTTAALAAVLLMLEQYGWSNVQVTVALDPTPVTATTGPNTWNIYAQWGGGGALAQQDAPPVWIMIKQRTIPNSNPPIAPVGPIDLGTTKPNPSNPPDIMPW